MLAADSVPRSRYDAEPWNEEKTLTASIVEDRVLELLDTDWFNEQYSGIKIILWGGEPTLNMDLCVNLMNAFMHNERVCFFVYTNGSKINEMMDTLRDLKRKPFIKGTPKVTIQVSYDGNPSHDLNRLDINGRPTSSRAIHAISELDHYEIDFGLKATMAWKDYAYLPYCYLDFKRLHKTFGSKIKYALTVDYYDVQFEKYKKAVENSLIFVAQEEIKFYKEFGYYLSNIFKSNRAFCATGKSMACVDTHGDLFYCHGSIYSKCSKDLKYTNIFSKHFINSIEKANKFFFDNHVEPEECQECVAMSCLRCNVKKYEESNKETFKEKWFDYPAQQDLCKYYQLVGKIGAAMGSVIKV